VQKLCRIRCLLLIGVGLFWLPTVALAANQAGSEPELFGGGQWLLSLLSLILVVFLAYWTTRFLAGRYRNLPTRHIKVAETLCLGSNRYLYLLIINKRALLVGGTEHGLALIKEYDDPGFCEELQAAAPHQSMAAGKLINWFTPLLKNQGRKSDSAKPAVNVKQDTNRFKALLTSLIDESEPKAMLEETRRALVHERLIESLARIRAWKTKGRG
jgi:flagellar biogenesis protein FliO